MRYLIAVVLIVAVVSSCGAALPQCTLDGAGPSFRVHATADEAVRSAAAAGCPLIAFVNQPARVIPGAVTYRADPADVRGKWTWAGSATWGGYLPADATDAELLAAAAAQLPRRLPVGPAFIFGCPAGRCR
jgi:hypothetical protein